MFEDWKRIYQNRFNPASYDLRTAELWAVVMTASGMTMGKFQTAYQKSLIPSEVGQNGFPPSSADDFIALASAYNYADTDTAFNHACSESGKMPEHRKWLDCVIYETSRRCGITALARCSNGYIKRFSAVYDEVIKEHKQGQRWEVPKPLKAIEKVHIPASPEFVDELMKKYGWLKG